MSTATYKPLATIVTGQHKLTTSAVSIGSSTLTNGVIIKAATTNTGNVFLGDSTVTTIIDGTGNGYCLEAGSEIFIPANSLSIIYAIGTAGDVISYIGV